MAIGQPVPTGTDKPQGQRNILPHPAPESTRVSVLAGRGRVGRPEAPFTPWPFKPGRGPSDPADRLNDEQPAPPPPERPPAEQRPAEGGSAYASAAGAAEPTVRGSWPASDMGVVGLHERHWAPAIRKPAWRNKRRPGPGQSPVSRVKGDSVEDLPRLTSTRRGPLDYVYRRTPEMDRRLKVRAEQRRKILWVAAV